MGMSAVTFYGGAKGADAFQARVEKEAYPDPTADEDDWVCVDLVPMKRLNKPVDLATIKADKALSHLPLVRQPRLSVTAVGAEQFRRILELGGKSSV